MTIHTYVCGFEGGSKEQWSASALAAISVTSTSPISQTYSGRINPAAAASNWDHNFNPAPVVVAVGRTKCEFPSALPTARVFLMRWPNTAKSYRLVFDSADNTIRMAHYSSGGVLEAESTGPVIAAGSVIRLDWKITGTFGPANQMAWSIDGVAQTTVGPVAGYTGGFSNIRLGELTNQTMDLYVDDIIVVWTNDAGDSATVDALYPIGEGYAKRLAPTGVGTHSGSGSFGTSSGLLADSWQLLDDLPMNTPAGYVEQTTIGGSDYLEYTHEDLPSGVAVNGVSLHFTRRSSNNNSNNAGIHAVDGATDSQIYDSTWLDTSSPYTVDSGSVPGVPWSVARVDALLSRFGYSGDVDGIPRLPSVHFEVDLRTEDDIGYWDLLLEGDL